MPSGPKKRKAAKKKKEANLNQSSHAYGDDDLGHLESKECHHNGGGAPPFRHHHSNLDQLTEDEKEENGNGLGENPVVGVLQSNENNGEKLGKEEIEDIIIQENGRYEHGEVGRSIDEEDKCNYSVNSGLAEEDAYFVDPFKAGVHFVPAERDDVNNEDDEHSSSSSNGAEDKPFETKNAEHIDSANGEVREALNDKEKDTEKNHTSLLIEHVGERKPIVMDEKVDVSAVRIAALLPKEKVLKHVDTTSATDSKDLILDDLLIHSNNIPLTFTDNEAKLHGDLGATPYEPSLVAAPGPLQKTSWRGCCGLFELFTRSG